MGVFLCSTYLSNMKYIITEAQSKNLKRIISKQSNEIGEGVLSSALSALFKGASKNVKKILPSFISKSTVKTLTDEINRLIPKNYLTNPKEVSSMVSKLNSLGGDVNKLNVNYIKKYGQTEYDKMMRKYLYDGIDKKTLISKLKNVKNPNIRIKPILGYGADHQVYKSLTNPDIIFKVELRPGEIDKWYNTFNSHPELFAKTYKKVKVKGKNGEQLTAAVMEKLDVAPFQKLWDEMETLLSKSQQNLSASEKTGLERLTKKMKGPYYGKQWSDFLTYLKTNGGASSQKINEFSTLVDKLYKVTPNPDVRKFNFGYNKEGVLKSLDL